MVLHTTVIRQRVPNQHNRQISSGDVIHDVLKKHAPKNWPQDIKRVRMRIPNRGREFSRLSVPVPVRSCPAQRDVRHGEGEAETEVEQRSTAASSPSAPEIAAPKQKQSESEAHK